jgi:spermidine/putrescine ABC transporter ATP-binding subunit
MSQAARETDVTVRGLSKRYGAFTAVENLDLDLYAGEFLTLLGPSGCGKTTTLNMLAGFITPDTGTIILGGKDVTNLPPNKRNSAMVFQQYALFPHMTVAENVGYGLKMRRVPVAERRRRAAEALATVGLEDRGGRFPKQLSGGQQQRVALARAIAVRPKVLLLDEPLSNLDLKLREQLRLELIHLQREVGITTVFVTHDQTEALVMSDRIAVMNAGKVEQLGTPEELYQRPANQFVANFIGQSNIVRGRRLAAAAQQPTGTIEFELANGQRLRATCAAPLAQHEADILMRPESLTVGAPEAGKRDVNRFRGVCREIVYQGSHVDVVADLEGIGVANLVAAHLRTVEVPRPGEAFECHVEVADCYVIPAASGVGSAESESNTESTRQNVTATLS